MQQYVRAVTLGVADLDRSRAFYSEGLGWSPTLDLEEVVFYQAGHGLLLALFPIDELAADAGQPTVAGRPADEPVGAAGVFSLGHTVDDPAQVDAAIEDARRAGAAILKEPQRAAFGGYHGYFADPDGHRWEVVHNPGLSVDADGTVTLRPIDSNGTVLA